MYRFTLVMVLQRKMSRSQIDKCMVLDMQIDINVGSIYHYNFGRSCILCRKYSMWQTVFSYFMSNLQVQGIYCLNMARCYIYRISMTLKQADTHSQTLNSHNSTIKIGNSQDTLTLFVGLFKYLHCTRYSLILWLNLQNFEWMYVQRPKTKLVQCHTLEVKLFQVIKSYFSDVISCMFQ